MLLERLLGCGTARHIKFPIYDLESTGSIINEYLRAGNPHNLTPREFQFLNIQNRMHFALTLDELNEKNDNLILEDYTGTGIAWGIGAGVDKDLLIKLNNSLGVVDVNILLDGERFIEAKETGHIHEENGILINKVRQAHLELAKEFGWSIVNTNDTKEVVHEKIWSAIQAKI